MTETDLQHLAETAYQKMQAFPAYTMIRICDLAEQDAQPVPEDRILAFMAHFNRLCSIPESQTYYHLLGSAADPGALFRRDTFVCRRDAPTCFELIHFRDSLPVLTFTLSQAGGSELQLRAYHDGELAEGRIYPLSQLAYFDLLRAVNLIREGAASPDETLCGFPRWLFPISCRSDSDFWLIRCSRGPYSRDYYIPLKEADPTLTSSLEALIQSVHPDLMDSCSRLSEVK